ncbi:hypothetical protein K439DRAFT_1657117 [Ramaria rubella]|nr:hypothetical protein K439DRAFT_1657117 [Ramaria rubella]
MFSKVFALAFVASAAAQSGFSITSPGPNTWQVLQFLSAVFNSLNTLSWSPCDTTTQASIPSFNVVVMNSNQQLLSGNLSILGAQPTFDCSKTIPDMTNIAVGTGYTMFLTNSSDTLQVLASTTFEMKAFGSTYPPPVTASSPTGSGNASSTNSSTSASPSPTAGGKNGATVFEFSLQNLVGAIFGAGAIASFF